VSGAAQRVCLWPVRTASYHGRLNTDNGRMSPGTGVILLAVVGMFGMLVRKLYMYEVTLPSGPSCQNKRLALPEWYKNQEPQSGKLFGETQELFVNSKMQQLWWCVVRVCVR